MEFFSALRRSRLLAAYVVAGPLVALYLALVGYGTRFLVASLANLVLLALYAAVINAATGQARPRSLPVQRPRLECALLALYLVFLLARGLARLGELHLGGAAPWLRQADAVVLSALATATQYLPVTAGEAARWQAALGDLFWLLLVPGLGFLALGYRPTALGFRLDLWWVGLVLLALGAWPELAALASGGAPAWPRTSGVAVAAAFLAGLAAEFFFRALLLTRLEALGLRDGSAIVATVLLYSLLQVPAQLAAQGYDLILAAAGLVVTAGATAGLAWSYLFLRTKSLAPGTLWHASPWSAFPF